MKKLVLVVSVCAAVFLPAASCCTVEKAAVSRIEATHEKVAVKLLEYIEKDAALSAEEKNDWKLLVDSDRRNIEALKRALEE